jgi:hypothetical protein
MADGTSVTAQGPGVEGSFGAALLALEDASRE